MLQSLSDRHQEEEVRSDDLESNRPKRNPFCSRCRNHGKSNAVKGHKRHCEYRNCICDGCWLVQQRQEVSAAQIKRRRYQKQDEESGRKIETTPPVLARGPSASLLTTAVSVAAHQQSHKPAPPQPASSSASSSSLALQLQSPSSVLSAAAVAAAAAAAAASSNGSPPSANANLPSIQEQISQVEEIYYAFGPLAIYAWLRSEQFDLQKVRDSIEISHTAYNNLMYLKSMDQQQQSQSQSQSQTNNHLNNLHQHQQQQQQQHQQQQQLQQQHWKKSFNLPASTTAPNNNNNHCSTSIVSPSTSITTNLHPSPLYTLSSNLTGTSLAATSTSVNHPHLSTIPRELNSLPMTAQSLLWPELKLTTSGASSAMLNSPLLLPSLMHHHHPFMTHQFNLRTNVQHHQQQQQHQQQQLQLQKKQL